MQDEKKFGKGKIIDRENGLVVGTVNEEKVEIQVREGLYPNTLYVTVAKEPLGDGSVKVGCHFGKGHPPATCIGDIQGQYHGRGKG